MDESFILNDPRQLLRALLSAGWRVIAPVLRGDALVPDILEHADDLPRGFADSQAPGRYRLEATGSDRWFDAVVGPRGWKHWLHPPEQHLWSARRSDDGFEIEPEQAIWPRTVLFGVRPCDLAAIARQAEVFRRARDTSYASRLAATRIVAVNCARSVETCFCVSMGTGPQAREAFDLALTETQDALLLEIGSDDGAAFLDGLDLPRATAQQRQAAAARIETAAASQTRALPRNIAEDLRAVPDSPRWEEIATRCLHCANCTSACPTCFCTNVTDRSDLSGEGAERWQRWDSCFSPEFTYLHGSSAPRSVAGRYRQWMTHKLSSWHDQFGASGCTGCGRCITWCPAGIDLVAEACALAEEE